MSVVKCKMAFSFFNKENRAEEYFKRGRCYERGEGVEKDLKKAVEWYTKAAEQGDAMAQNTLARCYKNGEGVAKDLNKSVAWYTKAAEQGDVTAQNTLAQCYENGEGVAIDLVKAAYWYKKVAEQGDATAQLNIGLCYETGEGVVKDSQRAVYWYIKAAEQGEAIAQTNLGVCYSNGEGVAKDQKKAVELYIKAAEQGEAIAQFNLGVCYSNGEGVAKDLKKAVEWYTKAAELGYATAQFNLGSCYFYGLGVEKNLKKAVEWHTKAAEQEFSDAQFNLGVCYFNGFGVEKDLKKAVEWHTKAAEKGHALAKCDLGFYYYEGDGVIKNVEEAKNIWENSCESQLCYDRAVNFGELAYLEGNYPKANRMLDLALNNFTHFNERETGATLAYLWKGRVYAKWDKYEPALVYLDKAINNASDKNRTYILEALREKAKVLVSSKQIKEARDTLKACLKYAIINNQPSILEEIEIDLHDLPQDDDTISNVTYLSAETVIQGNVGVYAKDDAIVNRPIVGEKKSEDLRNSYCPYCGIKLPNNARFCTGCGKQLQ